MQEQFKYRYFIDGKEIDTREEYFNTTMSGDYVSYFGGDSVFSVSFNSFFGENKDNNKMIKREVNGHLSDAINSRLQLSKKINEETLEKYKSLFKPIDQTQYNTLDLGQIKGSSTRHKSQNGETHKELTVEDKLKIAEDFKQQAFKQMRITPNENITKYSSQSYYTSPEKKEKIKEKCLERLIQESSVENTIEDISQLMLLKNKKQLNKRLAKISAEKTEKEERVRANFYRYINNNPIVEVKQFNSLEEAKNYFINSEWSEVFYYIYGTSDLIDKDSKIAEKETEKEENLVFQKDSEIHKEDNVDLIIAEALHRFGKKHLEDKNHETFIVGEGVNEGIKESNGKTDYSEINLEILDLMAERFTANKHKYPQGNMKKPIDIKSLEWALFRHVKKMIQPIETDEETYKDHLSAVLCNASMILDQFKNYE